MNQLFAERPPRAIEDVVRLASALLRLESSGKPFDAGQYRRLIAQLTATLNLAPPGDALQTVLKAFPTTATVYENLRYAHAGLCCSSLECNLDSERAAVAAIKRAGALSIAESGVRST